MGLDMYLTARKGKGKKEEIGYWRKHHDLHGFFEQLWMDKGSPIPARRRKEVTEYEYIDFNCIPVKLTLRDIQKVEKAVKTFSLPPTEGFFFGDNPPDDESVREDLKIFEKAKQKLREGFIVEYNSWW
jgi:hypothetical protein